MRTLLTLLSFLLGVLFCSIELSVAVPIVPVGFAYRSPYVPAPAGLPYFESPPESPSLYPNNPYPLGYSYGYGFGSFALTPYII